jgi:hypothetical protein
MKMHAIIPLLLVTLLTSCDGPKIEQNIPVRGEYGLRDITSTSATVFYSTTDVLSESFLVDTRVHLWGRTGFPDISTTAADVVLNEAMYMDGYLIHRWDIENGIEYAGASTSTENPIQTYELYPGDGTCILQDLTPNTWYIIGIYTELTGFRVGRDVHVLFKTQP